MNHSALQRASGVREMVGIRFLLAATIVVAWIGAWAVKPASAQQTDRDGSFERAPLRKEPTTPEETFNATMLTVDLSRLDLAARYFDQFMASAPDDETLLKLRDKYGTGDFLKLARIKELQPKSLELLDRLNALAKKQVEDPAFVANMIKRLIKAPLQRDLVMTELRNAGVRAVPEMLREMTSPEMAEHYDTLVIALSKMGKQIAPPLIGAINSPNEQIRGTVIDLLGSLDAKNAIPYLWFPAFDENQSETVRLTAKTTLARLLKGSADQADSLSSVQASNELRFWARTLYRKPNLQEVNDEGQVGLWNWDDATATVSEQLLTPEIASLLLSSRFARQAIALSPNSPEPQRQYLASILGLEVARTGWDQPRLATPDSAMYLALTSGDAMMSQVLSEALEAGQPTTAVASLEVLGQIGNRDLLAPQSGKRSPVYVALNSPDHRVQFAAAVTALRLDPQHGFPGASRVVSILSRALSDPGVSQAIVIDADNTRATITAGFLLEGGYEGIVCDTGRDGFERAATSTGIELIVVHVNCMRWELTQTLANLRADARTAAIPIVVYGPASLSEKLARLVARNSPATYVGESASSRDFLSQLQPFLKTLKTPPLSPQERGLQKGAAVYWLSTIANSNLSRVFDISPAEKDLSIAIEDPQVTMNALAAMGGVATPAAQQRLASVALNTQANEMLREAAASQLAFHIQRHGVLLTNDDTRNLVAGWKAADNPRVKTALAGAVGSLQPDPIVVGERVRTFPVPGARGTP